MFIFGLVLTANLTVIEIAMGGAGRAEGGAKPFFHLLQNLIYTIVLRSGIIFHH